MSKDSVAQLPWLRVNQRGRLEISEEQEGIYALGHLIRTVEQSFLDLFDQGQLSGTVHTSIGQEVCAIGILRAMSDPEDAVFSSHRNHAHFLAYCGKVEELIAEIMGKEGGVCGGLGGSQHLSFLNFHSSGVQGGLSGIAVGAALAQKFEKGRGLTAVFLGDGTLGQGLVYESMNLASVWQAPVLFVVEDNGIAQTTRTELTTGGDILARGRAFGLSAWLLHDRDPDYIQQAADILSEVRESNKPGYLVVKTARMGPHSKGDDDRPRGEKEVIVREDPLNKLGGSLSHSTRREIERANSEYVHFLLGECRRQADAQLPHKSFFLPEQGRGRIEAGAFGDDEDTPLTVGQSLNRALERLLNDHPEVIVLGEDLHDPYGGAFKITKGLSSTFPERVLSSPISEAGVVGAAIGLAMKGRVPIVEVMFADFLTLCMDQVYNHAVKLPWIFPGVRVSLVIRTPAGGNRGYGPTHSQSTEHLFLNVPGLTVVAGSHRHDVGRLLTSAAIHWPYPVLFVENKLLYGQVQSYGNYRPLPAREKEAAHELFPTLVRGGEREPDVTLVTYGGSLLVVEKVADYLEAEEESSVEIVVPSLLSPLPLNSLLDHLHTRRRILIVEETPNASGFGSELLSGLAESGYEGRAARIGALPLPIPAARAAERQVLPQFEDVLAGAMRMFFLNSSQ